MNTSVSLWGKGGGVTIYIQYQERKTFVERENVGIGRKKKKKVLAESSDTSIFDWVDPPPPPQNPPPSMQTNQ